MQNSDFYELQCGTDVEHYFQSLIKNNDFSIRFDNDSYINYSNGTITIKAKNVKIVQDEE